MRTAAGFLTFAIGAVISMGAWGQAVPPGTYQFTSGPGFGTPAFTVSGATTNLGGSVAGVDACSGLHIHGTFNGFADPGGACGHGIISLLVAPPPVSGGSMSGGMSGGMPGGMPTNVAGQLALTVPAPGVRVDLDILRSAALSGFALPSPTIDMVVGMFQGRSGGEGMRVNFLGGEVGGTVQDPGRAPAAGGPLQTSLADPAQRVLSSAAATSWLEELAVYDDVTAEGYRREAARTKDLADQWRELAGDSRSEAERNRKRAEEAREEGREADAKGWDEEAERDRAEAERRDREAERLDGSSEEQRQREADARQQAQERRDAAERAREQARQAERDRAERVRQQAEEKARLAREAREARRAKAQAEREARRQAAEDRRQARAREIARQRAAAESRHRAWLAEQEWNRNTGARGGSSAFGTAVPVTRNRQKEEEEKTWADYVVGLFEGKSETAEEKALQTLKKKLEEKLKSEAMQRTGMDKIKEQLSERVAEKIADLGLDKAAGKLGDGLGELKKIKEIGDWMDSELSKMSGRQRRHMNKIDAIMDPRNERVLRGAGSGSIFGRDVIDVYKGAVGILK